ncbi:MAG TPA: hypothetical protein PLJ47_18240 [Candidatus Hydrogenedentes bacterium]|nr:hypothetical protein [Candidatus Hydrogenedentota bacterium]
MNVCACPHCGAPRIVLSRIPKDVVVVMTCPNCTELVVVFRQRAAGLSRRVIEQGSFAEKKDHIAEIIAEFLDPSMFIMPSVEASTDDSDEAESPITEVGVDGPMQQPISEHEFDQFVRVDLNRIDESKYFRKYFG